MEQIEASKLEDKLIECDCLLLHCVGTDAPDTIG